MNIRIPWRVAAISIAALTLSSQAPAQTTPQTRLTGLIHDYTASPDASGPWQVVGEWSLTVNQASGRVDFIASLSMVRSENALRAAHTHHMGLSGGQIAALANGTHQRHRLIHFERQFRRLFRISSRHRDYRQQRGSFRERRSNLRRSGGRAFWLPADQGGGHVSALTAEP